MDALMERTIDLLKTNDKINADGLDYNAAAVQTAATYWLRLQVRYFNKKNNPNRPKQLTSDKAAAALTNKLKRRREILAKNPTKFTSNETKELVTY